MGRPPTSDEKKWLQANFPKVDVTKTVVNGDPTPVYNCLAWTLGITTAKIWPGEKDADFDKLYKDNGFSRSSDGPIAVWGTAKDKMTHGCISGAGHGPRWESKLGDGPRIEHGLTELEGSTYGKVRWFYAKDPAFVSFERDAWLSSLMAGAAPSEQARSMLAAEANSVPEPTRAEFERRYTDWRKTFSRLDIASSSNPEAVRHSAEFIALAAMGPPIIPLLLARLLDPHEYAALQVYDAIQLEDTLRVPIFSDEQVLGGEQYRALMTIRRWASR